MQKPKIIIADDDQRIRYLLKEILTEHGYDTLEASDGYEVLNVFKSTVPDLVLLDLKMPGIDGMAVLNKLSDRLQKTIIIVITAHGTIRNAIEATKLGVYDIIEKPIDKDHLLLIIENALKSKQLEQDNLRLRDVLFGEYSLIGNSPAMQRLRKFIYKAASVNVNVLLTGNNGTGKDLVAKNIHLHSARSSEEFVMVNCAAIPEHLIESELFGYEKGAFTGAIKSTPGKFEAANGGTIFLNEIGEMNPAMQAKLLHVLEMNTIQRLGGSQNIPIDVRVIAATNVDISEAISEKQLRSDLYYRLKVLHQHLPDLKEHKEDVIQLFEHFLQTICAENGLNNKSISPDAIQVLLNYAWPGNIRQLKNVAANLAILTDGIEIDQADVSALLEPQFEQPLPDKQTLDHSLFKARADFEREYIRQQLKNHHGNVAQTAESLKVERTHLYKLIKKLEIVV